MYLAREVPGTRPMIATAKHVGIVCAIERLPSDIVHTDIVVGTPKELHSHDSV